jgi:hypothetical protein
MRRFNDLVSRTRRGLNKGLRYFLAVTLTVYFAGLGFEFLFTAPKAQAFSVPGENFQICNEQSQYLTSPWTYDALASGTQTETVAQYESLPGYGTTLPPLPTYIADESSATTAAVIYASGATVAAAAYTLPDTPIIYFFEGGAYGFLGLQSISGDEFIGGSAPGYPEPAFNDGGAAGGISSGNDTYSFSGGTSTLAAAANSGATNITLTSSISNYASNISFADGTTYSIASATGTAVTLVSPLTNPEAQGSSEWSNSSDPFSTVSASAARGATTVTLTAASIPVVKWGHVVIGTQDYEVTGVTGSQAGYAVTIPGGLDFAINANMPVYYNAQAGGVAVEYLDISNDLHDTTGTITLGSGWTLEHNKIHDSYGAEGEGVAYYGGDEATIEYNCFSKMGSSGAGGGGTNEVFDYNEVYEAGYAGDPGCGCTGDKWWGTLNADIVDNAFEYIGTGGGTPAIWLDNGNTGTNITGNYFYHNVGDAIESETGYNLNVSDNLFEDDNWGSGSGCGNSNCSGDIGLNSSGGFNVPLSRYNDQISISGNDFSNDWGGITIWESGLRNCASSGEGFPIDAAYCTGGFPTTDTAAAGGQYYFSHQTDSQHGGTTTLDQAASPGDTTVMVRGPEAINDQIGFADPVATATSSTADVSTMTGAQSINVTSTTGFPGSGQLRVDTSQAGGGGGLTGAILSYSGTTPTSFTGLALVRGAGTFTGPVLQVQPYKVVSEACYSNDCALTISPAIASGAAAGVSVTGAGTCALFATSAATPTSPLAPNGGSYYDGCQWGTKNISITSNTFNIQPSYINSQTADNGGTTSCTPMNNCGTNFMAFQDGGTLPYSTNIDGNSMFSNASFTGCPSWDSGCSSNPLNNINASSAAPYAPANNGEQASNNLWSDNSYYGPWTWTAYNYGPCDALPSDPTTGKSMPTSPSPCSNLDFAHWQAYWQQDTTSTYNPAVATIGNLTANQEIAGSAQPIQAFQDTDTSHTLTGTLSVNTTPVTASTNTPLNFALNTLGYADGSYNIKFSTTDSGGNTSSATVPVYISNGDLNGDGVINLSDLAVMASHWGQTDSNYADGNITGQSTINLSDLAVMAANWGWSHP